MFVARDLDFMQEYHSMILYGNAGVGKTYLAGSAALSEEMSDVLFLSLEAGEKGLKSLMRVDPKAGNRIMVVPIHTFKEYGTVYEFLKKHIEFRDADDTKMLRRLEGQVRGMKAEEIQNDATMEKAIPNPKKFRTVVVDSLTEAQKYCMYQLLGINPETAKIDVEPERAQFAQWGSSKDMVEFLVRRLRDLPVNSIFTCLCDKEQDITKKWFYEPQLPGKLSTSVQALVDNVIYYTSQQAEDSTLVRRAYLQGGFYGASHIAGKNRFGCKEQFIDNPTMADIISLGEV